MLSAHTKKNWADLFISDKDGKMKKQAMMDAFFKRKLSPTEEKNKTTTAAVTRWLSSLAVVNYYENFLDFKEQKDLYDHLLTDPTVKWKQGKYGDITLPRLLWSMRGKGKSLNTDYQQYTGTGASVWTKPIEEIKNRLEAMFPGVTITYCQMNYYRDGKDHISWHSDRELLPGDSIYSLSLGCPRTFLMKPKNDAFPSAFPRKARKVHESKEFSESTSSSPLEKITTPGESSATNRSERKEEKEEENILDEEENEHKEGKEEKILDQSTSSVGEVTTSDKITEEKIPEESPISPKTNSDVTKKENSDGAGGRESSGDVEKNKKSSVAGGQEWSSGGGMLPPPSEIMYKLKPGSLLVMNYEAGNKEFLHCLKREPAVREGRINVTFRVK